MSLFQFVDEIDGSVLFEVKKDIIYRFKIRDVNNKK